MECKLECIVQWLYAPDNKFRVYKDIFCWQLIAFSFQEVSSLEVKFSLKGYKPFVCSLPVLQALAAVNGVSQVP